LSLDGRSVTESGLLQLKALSTLWPAAIKLQQLALT
jgi:hypothetical protein